MGQGHERRPLVLGSDELRVGGGVVQGVRLAVAARRERDRLGQRDGGLVQGHRGGPAQDAGRAPGSPGSRRTTTRALPGEPARTRTPGAAGSQPLELGERRLDLADELARRDVEQPVVPGPAADRDDRAVGEEPVRRAPEDPRRVGELGLHRGQRLEARSLDQPVQVPPAAPVRDEMEDPVRAPLGLGDRFVRATGREIGLAERAIGGDRRDAQAGGLPGHGRVVPLEPGETVARGRDPRRRHEVQRRSRGRADRAPRPARHRRSRSRGSPSPEWSSRTATNRRRPASKRRSA